MKKIIGLFLLFLVSCTSMPGSISVEKVSYDNSVQIRMSPGFASTSLGSLKIGFWKNTNMPKEQLIMIVRNDSIKKFSLNNPNFFMKIDGVEKSFSSLDKHTHCVVAGPNDPDISHCFQEYNISLDLLKNIQSSKDIKLKLNLMGNEFIENDMNSSYSTSVRSGVENLIKELEKQQIN